MQLPSTTLRCQYHYDALDQLIVSTLPNEEKHQRFYCKGRLATEIHGAVRYTITQHEKQLPAQQQYDGVARDTTLLITDQQGSVLQAAKANEPTETITYSPYGHPTVGGSLYSLLGINGERPDLVTGWYLLGNGYRPFNPVLMRFTSPDSLSPFDEGWVNAYSYCFGDPFNWGDQTGRSPLFASLMLFVKSRSKDTIFKTVANSYRNEMLAIRSPEQFHLQTVAAKKMFSDYKVL